MENYNDYTIIFLIISILIIIFIYFNNTQIKPKKEVELVIPEPIDKNVKQAINIVQTTQSSPLLS